MLQFFRRIRKTLLSENKFSKYMVYAIGEIFLVVIGILIALQINNWNERKKLKKQEVEALNEILSDLESNISKFEVTLNGANRPGNISNTITSLNILIDHLSSEQIYHDSLEKHFGIATYSLNNINYKTSGYESLSSIGLDLINNTKLRSEIGEYFSSSVEIPKSVSEGLNNEFENYMLDYLRKEFIAQNITESAGLYSLKPKDYTSLRMQGDFLESLKLYLSVYLTYQFEVESAVEASNNLKNSIESYLNE